MPASPRKFYLFISIGLILMLAVVYWNAPAGELLLYHDDGDYVTNNPHVTEGLSLDNLKWAFTQSHAANWHPLTWISHQLDAACYGLDPFGHHMTNLILHLLNTLFLFLVFSRMTGNPWRSAVVAALFAVHPLHVESVAWVAERKDLLSTFFMMLTLWAYREYARTPGIMRYLGVALLFILGLFSKPMLVTLPFVLLLLDYWPLKRTGLMRLCLEKVPLLALSALSSVVTVIVQKEGGAMQSFSLLDRISNALTAYVQYMVKLIWPANLSALYPHPEGSLPFWQVGVSAIVLATITLLVFRYGRRFPFLPVGWFWYLGTLVPVIGLVQVGNQAMADRYTYIPLIGLFLMAVWGIPKPFPSQMKMWGGIVAVLLLVLMVSARNQVEYWKDSPTLFQHALEVTEDNYLAEHDLGMALILSGKPAQGLEHLDKAVKIKPDWGVAYANLAMVHFCLKDIEKAREYARLSQKYGCELEPSFLRDLSEKED